jgi:arginase family enzyme
MTTVLLPFHQDEQVSSRSIALADDTAVSLVAPTPTGADQWQRLVALYDALAREVWNSVTAGGPTTVVAGDCLAWLGTLAGVQRAGLDPSVVWFDAHGDVHTMASSTSGYLGGMALRMGLGGDPSLLGVPLGIRPIPESRAVLVDARDLDPAETDYLATSQVTRTSVQAIGPGDLPEGPAIVHIDLDVIDPAEVPGLRFPAAGGPTTAAVLAAMTRLFDSGQVVVLDIACPWHEPTDDNQVRGRLELLARLTGSLWRPDA